MTAPAQFEILRETIVSSAPRPGETRRLVAITYQLAARPPQVVVIPTTELPDLVFLDQHPDEVAAPEDLVQEGQRIRNQHIQAQINRTSRSAV